MSVIEEATKATSPVRGPRQAHTYRGARRAAARRAAAELRKTGPRERWPGLFRRYFKLASK